MLDPRHILSDVQNGTRKSMQAAILLKRMSEELEECYKKVREYALDDFRLSGEKEVTIDGATITEAKGRAVYDFKGNPQWELAKNKVKNIEDLMKLAAKAMTERGESIVDEESGELIQPAKMTSAADSINIKLG